MTSSATSRRSTPLATLSSCIELEPWSVLVPDRSKQANRDLAAAAAFSIRCCCLCVRAVCGAAHGGFSVCGVTAVGCCLLCGHVDGRRLPNVYRGDLSALTLHADPPRFGNTQRPQHHKQTRKATCMTKCRGKNDEKTTNHHKQITRQPARVDKLPQLLLAFFSQSQPIDRSSR